MVRAQGSPASRTTTLGALHRYHLGNEALTRAGLLAYPTDPRAIVARLTRGYVPGHGGGLQAELYAQLGDALREQPAPPALRAGLYRALARVRGVVLAGRVTDRAGRIGLAIARTDHGVRSELVVDPTTSDLLAERQTLVDPARAGVPLPARTRITDTSYLERRVVAHP